MNLVSFPHYTCGGLICDILNDTWSEVADNGGIQSLQHSLGKIGDSDTVYDDFDHTAFLEKLRSLDTQQWIGTHCWLGDLDLSSIHRVINITTATYKSKLYRWVRSYHHYYRKSPEWQGLSGMAEIDKQRETAKNYLVPFRPIFDQRVINLEFADVVECNASFLSLIGQDKDSHIQRWKKINHFLYKDNIWTDEPAQRLHEAEYETQMQQRYVYQ